MKDADGSMIWTFRYARDPPCVGYRFSRDPTPAIEMAGSTAASYSAALEDDSDGSVNIPIYLSETCATGRISSFPSQAEFATAGVSIVAHLSTCTPTTPPWTTDGHATSDYIRMIQRRHSATHALVVLSIYVCVTIKQ